MFRILLFLLFLPVVGLAQLYSEVDVYPKADDSAGGTLCFSELRANGDHNFCIKAPDALTATTNWTLPDGLPGVDSTIQISAAGVISYVAAGSGLPVVDTTSIVEGSSDDTKELRFEVDGLTTSTIRVWTVPDYNGILAARNVDNDFSSIQTFTQTARFEGRLEIQDSGGVLHHYWSGDGGTNLTRLYNSTSGIVVQVDSTTSPSSFQITGHLSATGDIASLGGDILFTTDGASDIGTSTTAPLNIYSNNYFAGENASRLGGMTFYHNVTSGSALIDASNRNSTVGLDITTPGNSGIIGLNGPAKFTNWTGEPVNCTSTIYGAVYFDTTDDKLCVCINDGTDDEWVMSDDYTHATGHCSI